MSRTGGYTAFSSLLSIGNDTDSTCGLYELTVFALPGRNSLTRTKLRQVRAAELRCGF
jgi:hypothetical protein